MIFDKNNFPTLPSSWETLEVDASCTQVSIKKKIAAKEYLEKGSLAIVDQGAALIGGYWNDLSNTIDTQLPVIVFGDHTRILKYIDFPFAAGADGTKILRPHAFFYPRLFYRFLQIIRLPDRGYSRHFQFLRNSQIAVPPENEQKRIADKLDTVLARVDACRDRLDRIPAILKRFRQSVLAAAVSGKLTEEWREIQAECGEWNYESLESLIAEGPKNGLYKASTSYGQGTRILRIDNFYAGFIDSWEYLKRLTVDSSELDDFGLRVGDIVVNRVNSMSHLGKSALVRDLPEPCVFESNMMRIRLDRNRILPEFGILVLTSPGGIDQLQQNAKQAVNQASINQGDVKAVLVALPSIPEQSEIVRRVESLFTYADRLEARYNSACAQVEKLTPALLAKAFRGELVPQDPNDEPASELLARIAAAQPAGKVKKTRKASSGKNEGVSSSKTAE